MVCSPAEPLPTGRIGHGPHLVRADAGLIGSALRPVHGAGLLAIAAYGKAMLDTVLVPRWVAWTHLVVGLAGGVEHLVRIPLFGPPLMLRSTRPALRRLLLLTTLLLLGACRSSAEHEAEIGRTVAAHLDPLNGLPTAVFDEYRCWHPEEPCRERGGYEKASLLDAMPLVSAFAKARGIPVLRYEDAPTTRCSWATGTAPAALYAEFMGPPRIRGDSARVLLATVCADVEAFEQVHEFRLRRNDGHWIVESRILVSIT